MFAVVVVERGTGRVVVARDRLGIKPVYLSRGPGRVRIASSLPALVRAGGVDTEHRPGGAAPLPELPLRRPGAAHDPGRGRQAAPGHRADLRGRRPGVRPRLLDAGARAPRRPGRPVPARVAGRGAGQPADGGAPADGRRRPGRRPALRRAGLLADRRPAGGGGAARPGDVLHRLRGRRGPGGRRVRLLRRGRRALRHRPPPTAGAQRRRARRAGGRDRGDERAHGQPRLRGVLPARASRQPAREGGAERAGRRRGAGRVRLVPAAGRRAGRPRGARPTPGCSWTARTPSWPASSPTAGC